MKNNRLPQAIASLALASAIAIGAAPAVAQLAVFDPTNYAQNILQATRALEQVNNQVQQLQHEATMLENMATNLKTLNVSSLLKINADLAAINQLMEQAKGIAFTVQQTEAALKAQFPSTYSLTITTNSLAADAQTRWESTMAGFQQTMLVQSQVDEAIQTDSGTLNDLLSASEKSEGSLQAQQASNQLLALSTKQQMQIETLMAAQFRAEAVDAARRAQGEAAAKAATRKFLGTGSAYTPQ